MEDFLSEGPDEKTYTYTSNIGQSLSIQPGKIVDILYDPSKVMINTFVQSRAIFKLLRWIFIGVALLSFLTILI